VVFRFIAPIVYELRACCNLPFGGGARRDKKCSSPKEKMSRVSTNVYSRKTLKKIKMRFVNFENKGSGVVYARGRY